jgi:myosin-5
MAHIYEVGTRAWQPDPTEGWLASEVKEKLEDGEKVQLIFELENGEVTALERMLDAQSCLLSLNLLGLTD